MRGSFPRGSFPWGNILRGDLPQGDLTRGSFARGNFPRWSSPDTRIFIKGSYFNIMKILCSYHLNLEIQSLNLFHLGKDIV